MRIHFMLAIAFSAMTLHAQSLGTLPKGWDSTEGIEVGTTNNDAFWVGFDSGAAYNPSKVTYMYDSADFPWNPTQGAVITKLSFRRDGLYNAGSTGALTKKWVIIISTSNVIPARANFNWFEGNHGTNKKLVFGTIGTGKDVVLPATAAPTSGTAPFNVTVNLDSIFVVPANAKTLVIEIRTYGETVQTAGTWRADSVLYPGTGYNGGSYALTNTNHCVTPSIFYTSRAMTLGSNFVHVWRSQLSPGGKPMLTWLGPPNANSFKYPGSQCDVLVFPVLALSATTTGTSGQYAGIADWGTIPYINALIGASIDHQSMVVDTQYPGGVGLTRAGKSTVGTGYDPTVTQGSAAYSYGPNTIHYHGSPTIQVIPDQETYARYLYRRSLIIQIN